MKEKGTEKRRYLRLNTVFPVEFQVVNSRKEPQSDLLQGFTRNVGKGGMCIETRCEKNKEAVKLKPGETKLKLLINIPSNAVVTDSYATVKWVKKISEYILDTYIFGIQYDEIESDNQKMIEQHVLWLHRRPKVIFLFFFVFLVFVVLLTYFGVRIR